ncbi:MAG: hydrogenase maturation protease [Gemmatimonadota bacterium]|nr:hydrogenase maturation protease [Gemmatimonadota bacterium]
MTAPLVIGIGNPTRSDDGAGLRVVGELARLAPWASFLAVHQLTPELAEDIAAAGLVVFVDAAVGATELTVTPVEPTPISPGSHVGSPGALLELTARVYGKIPASALQVAIPACELGFGEILSPATAGWVGQAVTRLADYLGGERGMAGPPQ